MYLPRTAKALTVLRHQHSAWQLLASRRAPLVLACLQPLFESAHKTVQLEDAEAYLSDTFNDFANDETYQFQGDNFHLQARRELTAWIKKGLIVERQGELFATDALQRVFHFIDGLSAQRFMTSTASRLATVQRKIENLAINLNRDIDARRMLIERDIRALEEKLALLDKGVIDTLSEAEAVESIQDLYSLAMSLKDDFRRVEDTYREADRELRHKIIQTETHRGEIVDQLLDNHDALLETPEGRVFEHFHDQLQDSVALLDTQTQLREIMHTPASRQALTRDQQSDLTWLFMVLTQEAGKVGDVRARSGNDVKQFIQTGLASEHHRVGQLIQQLLETAINIDWSKPSLRRSPTPLPPIAVNLGAVPLIERLRAKVIDPDADETPLNLTTTDLALDDVDDEFWQSFDSLDRHQLVNDTLHLLQKAETPLNLSELATYYQQVDADTFVHHDLEIFSVWMSLAREAGIAVDDSACDTVLTPTTAKHENGYRFALPHLQLDYQQVKPVAHEV